MQKRKASTIKIPDTPWLKHDADVITNGVFDEKYMDRLHNGTEHYYERHYNVSVSDILERVVTEDTFYRKNAVTSFEEKENVREHLENAILDNAELIAAWIADKNSPNNLECYTERSDEPIGYGVMCEENSLFYYNCYATKLVLSKDFGNAYNPANFRIKSVYPSSVEEDIELSNRDISKDLHQTKTYQTCSETTKIKLDDFIKNGVDFVNVYQSESKIVDIFTQDPYIQYQVSTDYFSKDELYDFAMNSINEINSNHFACVDSQNHNEYEEVEL